MTGGTGHEIAALAGFGQLVRKLWARWPTTNTKATRFRGYLGTMYWLAMAEFAHGRRPHFNYYLRSMHALAVAWADERSETALVDALANAVKEEHVDANATA